MTGGLTELDHGLNPRLCKESFWMIVPMRKNLSQKNRSLKEFNNFEHLDLEYTPLIQHLDLEYTSALHQNIIQEFLKLNLS